MNLCSVLVADPPWRFDDRCPGKGRGADKHYQTMTLDDLKKFELPEFERNAIMFMWRVSAMTLEADELVRAWGFKPKSELVWIKTNADGSPCCGMGHYTRMSHEVCIIATRGSFKVSDRSVRSVFFAKRGRHSEKPDEFFDIVDRLAPPTGKGSRVELFARVRRPGWVQVGNELPDVRP